MGWFSSDSDQGQAYTDYNNAPHKSSITHELIAAAASYEAARAYENHVAQNGAPDSHAETKELLAAFAGGFVDKEVESKGLDFIDREKAKREATRQAEQAYDDQGNNF
ncbi:uncharacterized protein PHACADRAFT_254253 [Phanerochaete carnosa HHB-10118-sp]|uniref:Phosphoglycerate mutase family protein n=1 Tax=Phanerochaete carnosa (strain HHB-10118-sp) TaxID=650164 RepID=K5V2W4_PHACS|nr:uncharacterized protein PHACADRAFT_254253 [Phanerochaete carnosa HHB-10118-sp]EKM56886.1 hypothetical protein PHACADRAFT_254253 [Phanerochaete carnosa HHB-10118-sp]